MRAYLTGRDPLQEAQGGSNGPSVLTEGLIAGVGALVILVFVFGTLPAVAMPIAVAITSILTTFSLIWALTYLTPRLADRPVPRRARRLRSGHRLLAADDLPLP